MVYRKIPYMQYLLSSYSSLSTCSCRDLLYVLEFYDSLELPAARANVTVFRSFRNKLLNCR